MVTYEAILAAWETWHTSRSTRDWDALWLLTQERMEILIKASLRGRRVGDDELHGMIADATCSVMERLRAAQYADLAWIESRLHLVTGAAITGYVRRLKRADTAPPLDDVW